jgi:hypothetical protein
VSATGWGDIFLLAMPHGRTSVGAPERKESSRLVLLLSASGSSTGHRSGSGTRISNICPGTRLGSSANTGCRERRNTISPTCRRRPTCAPWRPPSRRDGFASRLTNQQLKEELGLDHFEGRSWQGLHRNALMTMIAYAFLQHRRLATVRREKKNQRTTAPADFASRAPRQSSNSSLEHHLSHVRIAENVATSSGVSKSAKVMLATSATSSSSSG